MPGNLDLIGKLRRIMNMDAAETFNQATDSLEALSAAIAALAGYTVIATGTLDTSSATVPADSTRTEGNDFFNGCLLMTVGGTYDRPTRIVDYTGAGGIFTLDPNNPLPGVSGLVPYLVLVGQTEFVPAADGTNARTPSDTIGNPADTALYAATATASIMRYMKALLGSKIIATGTLTTSSTTVPADTSRTEGNDYFKGCTIMTLTGDAAFQPRPIQQFTSGTDVFTLDEAFTTAPGLVTYVILASDYPVQRLLDIFGEVNAILDLTETGGTITTDGNVQTVYINNAPAGVYRPVAIQLDLTAMAAADQVQVRVYYRIAAAGGLIMQDDTTFSDLQDTPLKTIELWPNRYGIQVTLQELAGAHNDIPWEVLYEG